MVRGLVMLPGGPMLIASRPILTSEEQGPINGALIMGRYLDLTEVERLAEVTQLSLTVHRSNRTDLPADVRVANASLEQGLEVFVKPLNNASIAGYALLKDIYDDLDRQAAGFAACALGR